MDIPPGRIVLCNCLEVIIKLKVLVFKVEVVQDQCPLRLDLLMIFNLCLLVDFNQIDTVRVSNNLVLTLILCVSIVQLSQVYIELLPVHMVRVEDLLLASLPVFLPLEWDVPEGVYLCTHIVSRASEGGATTTARRGTAFLYLHIW